MGSFILNNIYSRYDNSDEIQIASDKIINHFQQL